MSPKWLNLYCESCDKTDENVNVITRRLPVCPRCFSVRVPRASSIDEKVQKVIEDLVP